MIPKHDPKGWATRSADYKKIRAELLAAETALKDQRERVAALRRTLPLGPVIPEDYVFHEGPADIDDDSDAGIREVRMSALFAPGKDSLVTIHMMFGENDERGCPMCSAWADTYNAASSHVSDSVNFVLIAKKEIRGLRSWARSRRWDRLRLLSSHGNSFNLDFGMQQEDGSQLAGISVFRREQGAIHHFYSTAAGFTPNATDPGVTEYRGIDLFSPIWHLLDLLPEGRGDWNPKYSYE